MLDDDGTANTYDEEGEGLTRRDFARGVVGATITSGLFTGCKPCFSPFPPKHELKSTRGPRTFTVQAKVQPSRFRALRRLLDDPDYNPFVSDAHGVHYARFFTAGHDTLYFMVIYDDYWNAIRFLGKNAQGVDRLFGHCSDYPAKGAADAGALDGYVRKHLLCVELFYRAYDNNQGQLRDALVLRDRFLRFLRNSDGGSEADLRARYADFLHDPHLLNHDRKDDNDIPSATMESTGGIRLTSVTGPDRVGPFTMMARIKDGELKRVKRLMRLGTFATVDLGIRPLKNLPTLHFARVSIVNGNYMLFASVYDGDFLQYVEDFGTRIAKEIDKIFGACVGYPLAGSRDIYPFRQFLQAHQIKTNAFGGSYLDRSLLQLKSSIALSGKLGPFTRRYPPQHRHLVPCLNRFLSKHQDLLT